MTTASTDDEVPGRIDLGRMAMVPLIVPLTLLNADRAAVAAGHGDVVDLAGAGLSATFYLLVLRAYANRSPARATSRHWPSHVAAVGASWLVFVFPLLPHGSTSTVVSALGAACLLAGSSWALWSLRTLGRSFSVLAQARTLVNAGPYRLVRHPLYFGEIVGAAGLALLVLSAWSVATWCLLVALQLYRSVHEEKVLVATWPEYEAYRAGTKRIVPRLV